MQKLRSLFSLVSLTQAAVSTEFFAVTDQIANLDNYMQFVFMVDRWQNHELIPLADRADQIFRLAADDETLTCPLSCSQVWFIAPRKYRNDFLYEYDTNYFRCCPGNALLALARGQICGGLPWTAWNAQSCCLVLPEPARHHLQQAPFSDAVLAFLDSWSCRNRWSSEFQLYWDRGIVSGQYEAFLVASNNRASEIDVNHREMSLEVAAELRHLYSNVVLFGQTSMWSVIEKLALTFDRSDSAISIGTSQFLHCMQLFEGMLLNGETETWKLLAALLHDVGKTLSLVHGVPDEHVDGSNFVLHCEAENAGLDNCILTYSHDEFGYAKLNKIIPSDFPNRAELLYVVRFHSIHSVEEKWLDDKDRVLLPWLFEQFHVYDHGTKNPSQVPDLEIIARARTLVDTHFPDPIVF